MHGVSGTSCSKDDATRLISDKYGKCRCCLTLGKHQYNFGKAELEMLMENLNLFLMADPKLPHLLCSDCVTSLNEVQRFRQKVMASETELRRIITEDIKSENVEESSQKDPLELNDVKTEHDYEQALSVNSETNDDLAVTRISKSLQIEFEPLGETSRDSNSETTVKTDNESNSPNKSDVEPQKKELVKTRRLRLVPTSSKGLHLVPINSKDLRLIPESSKRIRLVSQSSKGIRLVSQSSKGIRVVSQSSKGLRLVPKSNKGLLCVEPLTDVSTNTQNENEEITISKDNRKRRINGNNTQTRNNKKSESNSESDTNISEPEEEKLDPKTAMLKSVETARHLLLKDNRKVRSNIILILKHSTVLPFTNNFKFAFKCFYCDKLYIPFKELKEHIETDHKDVSLTTITKIIRKMHDLIVTADISCIKCRLCDEECESIENLIEHLCKAHDKVYHETDRKPSHGILGVDLSSDTLKCHICNQDHTFFKNLLVHMNEHYGVFVCYVCGKKFLSERRYKSHVVSAHATNEIKCQECSKVFKNEPAMKYHVKRVHLKTRVKCLYCPETFTSGNYVKRLNHMAEVHGIKKPKFKCEICGKELANSASLSHHKMYTHIRTKINRCEICDYVTSNNSAMKKHMVVHTGEKNYECEFCKKTFAKQGTLRLHLKIHLDDKRFVCFLCDAAYIQKNSLKNHLRSRHPDSGIDINKL